eukprot:4612-Heterococcus_DN1.PRE.2
MLHAHFVPFPCWHNLLTCQPVPKNEMSQSLKARHHYGVFVVYYAPYTCETMFHTVSMLTQPVIMPSDIKAT